jgi:CheY-like chemotaxis protein
MLHALRRLNPEVRIVILSGCPAEGQPASLTKSICAYVAKPFTSEALLRTLHQVLQPSAPA